MCYVRAISPSLIVIIRGIWIVTKGPNVPCLSGQTSNYGTYYSKCTTYKRKRSCQMYVILRFVIVYSTILCRRDRHDEQPHPRQLAQQQPKRHKGLSKPRKEKTKTIADMSKRLNIFGKRKDGVQTQDTREKQKVKQKSQRSRWRTTADTLSSCGRGGA